MQKSFFYLLLFSAFVSCGTNSDKQKELELKQKELKLKERELTLKEKDTAKSIIVALPAEKEFTVSTFSNLPKYFDEIGALYIYESFSASTNYEKYLFVGDEYENKGMCIMNINNELVELKFLKNQHHILIKISR